MQNLMIPFCPSLLSGVCFGVSSACIYMNTMLKIVVMPHVILIWAEIGFQNISIQPGRIPLSYFHGNALPHDDTGEL